MGMQTGGYFSSLPSGMVSHHLTARMVGRRRWPRCASAAPVWAQHAGHRASCSGQASPGIGPGAGRKEDKPPNVQHTYAAIARTNASEKAAIVPLW